MPGFGVYPSALSPFGLGTPIPATPPPTGEAGVRYINPATGDYEQDPVTKQLAQMPTTRQRVLLAVATLRRSMSVNPSFGVQLPRKMGTFFDSEAKQAVRAALAHLTETEQAIRIDDITVERGAASRARIVVSFTDLTIGKPDKVAV